MIYHVTLNRTTLKEKIKDYVLQNIRNQLGNAKHFNHDSNFSPSQWWASGGWDVGWSDRRTLATAASIALDGDIIKVILDYQVQNIDS